jgi:uncharacterized membrane protein HdeD (DUF308 family)
MLRIRRRTRAVKCLHGALERILLRAGLSTVGQEGVRMTILVGSSKALAVRGLAAVMFGIFALLMPQVMTAALVLFFGAYALVDGVTAIAAATQERLREHVGVLVLEGVVGITVGLAALLFTNTATIVLIDLVAAWAILTGILEIIAAARLRKVVPGELLLGFAGVTSIAFGVSMLVWPKAGALAIVALLGCYAIVFGAAILALAWRMRRLARLERSVDFGRVIHASPF